MLKNISAMKARKNFGQVMNEVSLKGVDYVIERAGKPMVAIISMEKYQFMQKERVDAFQMFETIWKKMDGEKPDMPSLSQKETEYVKTIRVLSGETLYSNSWLEI